MNLIKRIFGKEDELTSRQFYFPYFFDKRVFSKLISPFGLMAEVRCNEKTKIASELNLISQKEIKLTIGFGQSLMVQDGDLMIWSANKGSLIINKFNLEFNSEPKTIEIEIQKLEIGVNQFENDLGLTNFVTYIRSDKIKYNLDFHESYGIIIITGNTVELIPFDWFNEKGGDYGYVWPAVAQLDSNENLIGDGMRMGCFKIGIRKDAYNNIFRD